MKRSADRWSEVELCLHVFFSPDLSVIARYPTYIDVFLAFLLPSSSLICLIFFPSMCHKKDIHFTRGGMNWQISMYLSKVSIRIPGLKLDTLCDAMLLSFTAILFSSNLVTGYTSRRFPAGTVNTI